jgi:hypothetical protein
MAVNYHSKKFHNIGPGSNCYENTVVIYEDTAATLNLLFIRVNSETIYFQTVIFYCHVL